jgi:hypothetical protein
VIRDHNGLIICSARGVIPHCQNATVAEAIACIQGLDLSMQHSMTDLIIESYCLTVIEAFKDGIIDMSEVSIIAKEFKLKKPPDQQVKLVKIDRKHNMVSHDLCQYIRRELSNRVLLSAVPTYALRSA